MESGFWWCCWSIPIVDNLLDRGELDNWQDQDNIAEDGFGRIKPFLIFQANLFEYFYNATNLLPKQQLRPILESHKIPRKVSDRRKHRKKILLARSHCASHCWVSRSVVGLHTSWLYAKQRATLIMMSLGYWQRLEIISLYFRLARPAQIYI